MNQILQGDCLEQLKALEQNSLDSLVTDPPAGISFMGKDWDGDKGGRNAWVAWMRDVMTECHRALKPGAHGLVWALPRTSHWTATALEDAGFEIRDVVTHLFGSGFPKSMDVSKAMDKAAGAERTKVLVPTKPGNKPEQAGAVALGATGMRDISAPSTDLAKAWNGWGTALKPASEHWILVRKPLAEKTVAKNVAKWGTGAINIDASRVGTTDNTHRKNQQMGYHGNVQPFEGGGHTQGRFPANLVLSCPCDSDQHALGCAVGELDKQSGVSADKHRVSKAQALAGNGVTMGKMSPVYGVRGFGDSGGASRFFYVAKPSRAEKNAGCEGMEKKLHAPSGGAQAAAAKGEEYRGSGGMNRTSLRENHHPTVKPVKLMRYLIRMITPPGGTVLDPFLGSGTTGVAAKLEGFRFIGIEREPEYAAIATARIEATA